jgi:hypothetical protein
MLRSVDRVDPHAVPSINSPTRAGRAWDILGFGMMTFRQGYGRRFASRKRALNPNRMVTCPYVYCLAGVASGDAAPELANRPVARAD